MSERAYGAFERSFALPSGLDRDKIAANLEKSVLTITLPKTPEAQKQQKKIEVTSATDDHPARTTSTLRMVVG